MSRQFIGLFILLALALMIIPATASVITMSDAQVNAIGDTATMNLNMDSAPEGISGYIFTISLSNPSAAEITGVTFPTWTTYTDNSTFPGTTIWVKGYDGGSGANGNLAPGATNIPLGTVTLLGKSAGSTNVIITVTQFDDDSGGMITPSIHDGVFTVNLPIPPTAAFHSDIQTGNAPLTVQFTSDSTGTAPLSYQWDFNGDGVTDSIVQNPLITFSDPGTYPVNLTVRNSAGSSSLVKPNYIVVSKANTAPVAADQSVSMDENTAKDITLSATDADNDVLTYAVVSAPTHGTLGTVSTTGVVTYTPAADYVGTDSFTFTANDGKLDSAPATVTITVNNVNKAPVAADQTVSINENTVKDITLGATDADGDTLTFVVVTSPTHGTLGTVSAAGVVTYTPGTDYNGPDSFTFKVNDGTVDSNTATVSISVDNVNKPPVAADQSVSLDENTAKDITLGATDADGDTLTYSVVAAPAHGTLGTVSAAGVVTYTPAADYAGSDSFTFKVNDGTIDSATATVSITVNNVNKAPVANAQSVSTDENTAKEITLSAADADGDVLTYAVVAAPAHGTLGTVSSTGVVTYTPTADYVGSDSFTFKVNDGTVDSAPATVDITVNNVNKAPVANAQSVSTDENTAKEITLSATDLDGDVLTYAVVAAPAHGTLGTVSSTGVVTYTPAADYVGSDSFTFKVNDGTVDSAPATVDITVNAVNTAPVANAQVVSTEMNLAKVITLTGSDADGNTLTYAVVAAPAHGTLGTISSAGVVTYTPTTDYTGTDSFTFKVNDGTADSVPATVSITVTPHVSRTWTVGSSGSDFTLLTDAISSPFVTNGDTIFVYNGTYTFTGLTKSITLTGESPDLVTINLGAATAKITGTGTIIERIRFTNGQLNFPTTSGGATNMVVRNCVFEGLTNPGSSAGSINLYGTNNTLSGNTFKNNAVYNLIYLTGKNNVVEGNTFTSTSSTATIKGVVRLPTSNGVVRNNSFSENSMPCILIQSPVSNAKVYLNNFVVPNGVNPVAIQGIYAAPAFSWITPTTVSYTYMGTPYTKFLGNYYNTYTGVDADSDGIGDTSYPLVTNQIDSAPLMDRTQFYFGATHTAAHIIVRPASPAINVTETQQFTATATDTDGLNIPGLTYTWSSSDETVGTITQTGLFTAQTPGVTTITASNGGISDTSVITVVAQPPVAAFISDVQTGTAPLTVTFTNQSTGYAITAFAWDFENDGTIDSTAQDPVHIYSTAGTFTVNLTVTNAGGSDSEVKTDYITVNAANTAPVAADQSVSLDENTAKDITLAATDAEGNALTYAVIAAPAHGSLGAISAAGVVTYTPTADYAGSDSFTFKVNDGTVDSNTATVSITVNNVNKAPVASDQSVSMDENTAKEITLSATDVDGDTLTYAVVAAPAHGTLGSISAAGVVTYTPTTDYAGSDSFTFKVNDGTVDSNTATVSITVNNVNKAPVANAQSVSTDENTAKEITLSATDADGDVLSYAVVAAPAHGTLGSISAAGVVTYTPAADYAGSDSFTFKVNDGTIDSAPATVSITVNNVNKAPVANAQSVSTDENTAKEITLSATDADGDVLSYAVVAAPAHGTLGSISAAGVVTYTPAADYAGSDSFTFKVNDGTADSNIATVSITVNNVNKAPVANAQSVSTDENTAKEITLSATDADGDVLSYAVVAAPAHGTLGSISAAGVVTYTPAADYAGSDSFTFKVNDGTVDSNTATVSITVNAVNTAPVASAQSVSTDKNVAKAITLVATDADGDTLTYAVVAAPAHGSLSTISAAGVVTYTPATDYVGSDSFTFKVNDGQADSNTATVSITVNAVPVASMTVEKSASVSSLPASGGDVTYTYLVKNTGSVSLLSVTLTDDKLGPITGPASGDTNANGALDAGETWTYAATTTLTATTTNTATATGSIPGTIPVSVQSNAVTVTVGGAIATPEFPTMAFPVMVIVALAFLVMVTRKE